MVRIIYFAFLLMISFSCSRKVASFSIQNKKIKELAVIIGKDTFSLNDTQKYSILNCVDGANYAGIWKGIKREKVQIVYESGDTSILYFMGEVFHTDKDGKYYKYKCDKSLINQFLVLSNQKSIERNYATLSRIFENYVEFDESIDSKENKVSLTQSFMFFSNQNKITDRELQVIINLWMYYDATDYMGLNQARNVFYQHRKESLLAIKKRIDNKKKWEEEETSPFSDLLKLYEELQKKEN